MDYNDKQIGRNIKAIRNANKKNYFEFAEAIGISESLLEKIENGTRHATDEIIQLVSNISGFSFTSIKYEDLSYLEKGELHFEEDISIDELTETDDFKSIIISLLKVQFPILEEEKMLEDDEFSAGINIAHNKIQTYDFTSTECVAAINHFIHSSINRNCADFSAINILSCFGYLYNVTVLTLMSADEITALSKERIISFSDYFGAVRNHLNQNRIKNAKREYLKKYNGLLTKYMHALVQSKENSDYAYYFLCLRYMLGLMDEDITKLDEYQMKMFGESMFDSLWKMGNKYAVALNDYLTK